MSGRSVRTAEEWAAKRAELSERWRGRRSLRSPMTFFEMEAAVMRDSADAGDGMGDYDRRGLLNVIAVLLDELDALLADTPSVEPPAVSHEATSATGQANSGGGRDADTARIAAVLRQLRPAPSGGYGYRALSAQNLAAALYDAGLRPSVEPAGLDVERLMVAIHRSGIAGCPEDCTSALDEYPSGADSDYATFLAREYAALLPTQASDSPEPKETR